MKALTILIIALLSASCTKQPQAEVHKQAKSIEEGWYTIEEDTATWQALFERGSITETGGCGAYFFVGQDRQFYFSTGLHGPYRGLMYICSYGYFVLHKNSVYDEPDTVKLVRY